MIKIINLIFITQIHLSTYRLTCAGKPVKINEFFKNNAQVGNNIQCYWFYPLLRQLSWLRCLVDFLTYLRESTK